MTTPKYVDMYCLNCRSEVAVRESKLKDKPIRCPFCKEPLARDGTYGPNGALLEQFKEKKIPPPPAKPKRPMGSFIFEKDVYCPRCNRASVVEVTSNEACGWCGSTLTDLPPGFERVSLKRLKRQMFGG